MTRVSFLLRVRPEMLDEYVTRHTPVRPDMLVALADAGRRNYSLFLADDGLVVGYYETDDDEAAAARLAASPVVTQWEAEMAPFFLGLDGRADQSATRLPEVFHLEDQLDAAAAASDHESAPS